MKTRPLPSTEEIVTKLLVKLASTKHRSMALFLSKEGISLNPINGSIYLRHVNLKTGELLGIYGKDASRKKLTKIINKSLGRNSWLYDTIQKLACYRRLFLNWALPGPPQDPCKTSRTLFDRKSEDEKTFMQERK